MSYRSYKFLIVPVLQEVDDEGVVVREVSAEQPTHVFGVEGLHKFADGFEMELAALVNGGTLSAR